MIDRLRLTVSGAGLLVLTGLAACEIRREPSDQVSQQSESQLEAAAIEAGILPDISAMSLAGAYERASALGTDKFCAVGDDDENYHIGMLAMFGPETKCEALGTARRNGEGVRITLTGEDNCRFTANFDGVELRVPGTLPKGCDSYCGPRATFAGTSYYLVGEGNAVALSTQGRDFRPLCSGEVE